MCAGEVVCVQVRGMCAGEVVCVQVRWCVCSSTPYNFAYKDTLFVHHLKMVGIFNRRI